MKRIWVAGVLALGLHALLLQMEFAGLVERPPILPASREIMVTIGDRPDPEVVSQQVVETEEQRVEPENVRPSPPQKILPVLPQKRERPNIEPEVAESPQKREPVVETMNMISEVSRQPEVEPVAAPPPSLPLVREDKGQAQGATAAVKVVREAIPLYKKNPPPVYPRKARRRGVEGVVLLEVLVDISGRVADLRVLSSSGHRVLDKAALKSVKKWRFVPARRGDESVEMWVRVPVRFELK